MKAPYSILFLCVLWSQVVFSKDADEICRERLNYSKVLIGTQSNIYNQREDYKELMEYAVCVFKEMKIMDQNGVIDWDRVRKIYPVTTQKQKDYLVQSFKICKMLSLEGDTEEKRAIKAYKCINQVGFGLIPLYYGNETPK